MIINKYKIMIFIAVLMLMLSLSACVGGDKSEQQNASDTAAAETTDSGEQASNTAVSDNTDTSEQQNSAETAEADATDDSADEDEAAAIGVPNPIIEATAAEVLERTGVSFATPAGAQDVAYFIIETDSSAIAQMTFTLNGVDCTCRICGAGVPTDGLEDISGMYYEWTSEDATLVGGNDAELYWIEGEQGIVLWYDYAPGLLYSLAVDSGATRDNLLLLAEELYNPVQGDADGASDEEETEEQAVNNDDAEEMTTADSIVALAQSLIGAEYEWGAEGPDTFDNSGFVYYCFTENGVSIPRKTTDMYDAGTVVEVEDLLPGDLVFFTYNEDKSASYVGIYIGDGQFIAENNEDSPVCIHDMTLNYYVEIYIGARRYF